MTEVKKVADALLSRYSDRQLHIDFNNQFHLSLLATYSDRGFLREDQLAHLSKNDDAEPDVMATDEDLKAF